MKKWIKRFLKSPLGLKMIACAGYSYLQFVFHTSSWKIHGNEQISAYLAEKMPFVICFWHGHMAMLPFGWRDRTTPFYMLLSQHRDGQLIGKLLSYFSIQTVEGSSTRGGTEAARQLIRLVQQGAVIGITPDGPKGPCYEVQKGVAVIAKLTNAAVFPVSFKSSRAKQLSTWDRFVVPLPFSRITLSIGKPLSPPSDSVDDFCKTLKEALDIVSGTCAN